MLQGPRISDDAWIHDVRIEDTDEGIDITIAVGTEEKPDVPIAEAKQDVYTRLGARPDAVVRVAMDQPSTRRIAARTGEVPGYGWARLRGGRRWPTRSRSTRPTGTVVLSNGLVRVEVDRADGTFSLDGMAGYGRLVDGGDLGDSYNYSPPRQDSLVDTPRRRDRPRRRAGPGAGAGAHHGHLRLARPRRRRLAGTGRRAPRRRRHRLEVRADERRGAGHDHASSTRAATTACASTCRCPSRPTTREAESAFTVVTRGPDRRGPARRVRAAHRAGPPLRQRRAASPWSTRVCASTS